MTASGEHFPRRNFMIAPAPTQSSKQGRSEASFHLSPAGMTAMRLPIFIAERATASQFLKHPKSTGVPSASRLRVEPLGEGNTRRVFEGRFNNEAGESERLSGFFLSATSAATTSA